MLSNIWVTAVEAAKAPLAGRPPFPSMKFLTDLVQLGLAIEVGEAWEQKPVVTAVVR